MLFRPTPEPPGPGQASVWDFPRPARAEPVSFTLSIVFGGRTIADTRRGMRVIETSHPPSYYFPPEDVDAAALVPVAGSSFCEWKGAASYRDVVAGTARAPRAAWTYLNPSPDFSEYSRVRRVLSCRDGWLLRGWRTGPAAGGWFLWRLDYEPCDGPVQGPTRNRRLVKANRPLLHVPEQRPRLFKMWPDPHGSNAHG